MRIADVSVRELLVTSVMIAALLFLGLYPQPVLDTASGTFRKMKTGKGIAITDTMLKADSIPAIVKEVQKP